MPKRKKNKGFKRSRAEWEETLSRHIGNIIDKLTFEDIVKFAMFGTSTYVLKELKLIHWEPLWQEPTPRQEMLNWMTNGMAAYLMIYRPEAITAIIRPLLKLPMIM